MRLLVNASTLRGFGSSQVGINLLTSLPKALPNTTITAFVPEQWEQKLPGVNQILCAAGLKQKMVTENLSLRKLQAQHDLLLSLGDTSIVFANIPHVLFVQQAHLVYRNREHQVPLSVKERLRFAAMRAYLRVGLPTVDEVVVQTHDMAHRFSSRFRWPSERTHVIGSAIDLQMSNKESPHRAPYFLYVSSYAPHKNHAILAPIMAAFPHHKLALTLREEEAPALVRAFTEAGVSDQIIWLNRVPREQIAQWTKHAQLALIPSLLESFGLPYYEALFQHTPVVACQRQFAIEALGDAGYYAEPFSTESWVHQIKRALIDSSSQQRCAARALSLHRTQAQVANEFAALLNQVVNSK